MQPGRHACLRLRRPRAAMVFVAAWAFVCVMSCDAFNPSFINLFDIGPVDGSSAFQAVDPPSGHVPIIFRNNARISDQVFTYVIQGDSVVREEVLDELLRVNPQMTREEVNAILQDVIDDQPVNLEPFNLPPRVRLTVDVTLIDGGVQRLEFLNGLRLVRGEGLVGGSGGAASLPPDLSENTNNTYIVQCDIAEIEPVRFDVFIPVVIRDITCEDEDIWGGCDPEDEVCELKPPQFDELEPNTDETRQNYDPRYFPPPVDTVQCGVVVIIELTGDLSIHFSEVPARCLPSANAPDDNRVPGYRSYKDIEETEADLIPGYYLARIAIRDQ